MKSVSLMLLITILCGCVNKTKYHNLEDRNGTKLSNEDLKNSYSYYDNNNLVKSSAPTLYSEFIKSKVELSQNQTNLVKMSTYINAGIALSNESCALWFEGQYQLDTKVNQNQNFFSLLRTLAVTAMTFEGKSAKSIGGVSLGFDGIDQGYEFFKENFLLTNTLLKLKQHVMVARKNTAELLKARVVEGYNYFDAQSDLRDYHFSCHPMALRGYIDESVALTRYVPAESDEDLIKKSKVLRLSMDLYKLTLGTDGVFNDSELWNLYLQFFGNETKEAQNMLTTNPFQQRIHERKDTSTCSDPCVPYTSSEKETIYTKLIELESLTDFKSRLMTIKTKEQAEDTAADCDTREGSEKNSTECESAREVKETFEQSLMQRVNKNSDRNSKSLLLRAVPIKDN